MVVVLVVVVVVVVVEVVVVVIAIAIAIAIAIDKIMFFADTGITYCSPQKPSRGRVISYYVCMLYYYSTLHHIIL